MLQTSLSKYLTRFISSKIIFLLDLMVSMGSSFITICLVNIITVRNLLTMRPFGIWMGSSFLFSFIFIWALHTNRIIIRHTTIREFGKFILLAFLKVVTMGFVFAYFDTPNKVLYVMQLGDFFMTIFAFFLMRITMLLAYDMVKSRVGLRRKTQNVLIYGVGEKSVSLIARLQNSEHYRIVGFVQFGSHDVNHVIAEKKVYYISTADRFVSVIQDTDADAILFATETDARDEKDRVIQYAIDNNLKILLAPSIDEMKDGKLAYSVRNIQIEDLLMRQEIEISMKEIKENFAGKTVLVTGAAGSIGSELCRQLAALGAGKLILFDNAETPMHNLRLEFEEKFPETDFVPVIGDVRQLQRLDYVFRKWSPQVVFHAAAYKHVPLMEENP